DALLGFASTAAQNLRKDVIEGESGTCARGAAAVLRAAAALRLEAALAAGGVDLTAIVATALHRIGEHVVGGGHLLELLLVGAVAGAQIGMQLLGEAAIGFLDVVLGSVPRHAEHGIGISHE